MPKIVLSEAAPKDAKMFSLANAEFSVPFETSDPVILGNAAVHPWLEVTREPSESYSAGFIDRQVKPEDDPMSALNDNSNDADAARAADEKNAEAEASTPLAVDAGLDQNEVVKVGDTNVTLAADETDSTDSAPKRRRGTKED